MAKTYYDHKPIIQTASPGFKANPLDSDIKGYCRKNNHGQLVGVRKKWHLKVYGTEASIEWLHRPKTNRGRPKKGEE